MATNFNKVLAEVQAKSNPQRQLVLKQIADLPTQQAAQESSLAAQKDQAYTDILGGARQRGLGFSGIPLGEQAKYAATQYAPAVANLKSTFAGQQTSLQSALNDIGKNDYMTARDIWNTDRAFAEQQRQFNEQMALQRRQAAASAAGGSGADYLSALSGMIGGGSAPTNNAIGGTWGNVSQKKNKGFNFTDNKGNAISAAVYAKQNNIAFRSLLQRMAKMGDAGAKVALNFVGNDFGYDPRKITNQNAANIYNALVWGSGKKATYKAPLSKATYNNTYAPKSWATGKRAY